MPKFFLFKKQLKRRRRKKIKLEGPIVLSPRVTVSGLIIIHYVIMGSLYLGIRQQPHMQVKLLVMTWWTVIGPFIVIVGQILTASGLCGAIKKEACRAAPYELKVSFSYLFIFVLMDGFVFFFFLL